MLKPHRSVEQYAAQQVSQGLPFTWQQQLGTDDHCMCRVWFSARWFSYYSSSSLEEERLQLQGG